MVRVDGAGSVMASGATEGAGSGGHIPPPVTFRSPMALADDGSLADGEDLRRACERLGGHGEPQGVVTYCTIGNRTSQVALRSRRTWASPTRPSSTAPGPDGAAGDTPVETGPLRAPWRGTPASARGAARRTAPPGARTPRR